MKYLFKENSRSTGLCRAGLNDFFYDPSTNHCTHLITRRKFRVYKRKDKESYYINLPTKSLVVTALVKSNQESIADNWVHDYIFNCLYRPKCPAMSKLVLIAVEKRLQTPEKRLICYNLSKINKK